MWFCDETTDTNKYHNQDLITIAIRIRIVITIKAAPHLSFSTTFTFTLILATILLLLILAATLYRTCELKLSTRKPFYFNVRRSL